MVTKLFDIRVSNDEFDNTGVIGKLSAALGMLWSFKNYKKVKKLVETEKPDIVHIHTFFPLSWLVDRSFYAVFL